MKRSLIVAALALSAGSITAEPLRIVGFETGSGITFQGATISNFYTIEFAMCPDGPWTNWGSITDQTITGTVMTAPSPVFYRIRQTDSSFFPPYAVIGHTHSNITSSRLAPGAVENMNIADGAVTESKLHAAGLLVTNLNADMVDGYHASELGGAGNSIVEKIVKGTIVLPEGSPCETQVTVALPEPVNPSKSVVHLSDAMGCTVANERWAWKPARLVTLDTNSVTIDVPLWSFEADGYVTYQIVQYR